MAQSILVLCDHLSTRESLGLPVRIVNIDRQDEADYAYSSMCQCGPASSNSRESGDCSTIIRDGPALNAFSPLDEYFINEPYRSPHYTMRRSAVNIPRFMLGSEGRIYFLSP